MNRWDDGRLRITFTWMDERIDLALDIKRDALEPWDDTGKAWRERIFHDAFAKVEHDIKAWFDKREEPRMSMEEAEAEIERSLSFFRTPAPLDAEFKRKP